MEARKRKPVSHAIYTICFITQDSHRKTKIHRISQFFFHLISVFIDWKTIFFSVQSSHNAWILKHFLLSLRLCKCDHCDRGTPLHSELPLTKRETAFSTLFTYLTCTCNLCLITINSAKRAHTISLYQFHLSTFLFYKNLCLNSFFLYFSLQTPFIKNPDYYHSTVIDSGRNHVKNYMLHLGMALCEKIILFSWKITYIESEPRSLILYHRNAYNFFMAQFILQIPYW